VQITPRTLWKRLEVELEDVLREKVVRDRAKARKSDGRILGLLAPLPILRSLGAKRL
jgi:hypothetical protein